MEQAPGKDATLTTRERRRRLVDAVEKLARAIDSGTVTPVIPELEAAVAVCEEQQLPLEAARIRRWLGMETKRSC